MEVPPAHLLDLILAQPPPHFVQLLFERLFQLHVPGELKDRGACE